MRLSSFAAPGLGAFVMQDDAGAIQWLGLFGHGLDGHDLCLTGEPAPATPNAFIARRRWRTSASLWPPKDEPVVLDIGRLEATMSVDGKSLEVRYDLDRRQLSAPDVEFSPPPPSRVIGGIMLKRLV